MITSEKRKGFWIRAKVAYRKFILRKRIQNSEISAEHEFKSAQNCHANVRYYRQRAAELKRQLERLNAAE